MNWQPIETAPMDGTNVLVMFNAQGVPVVRLCHYDNGDDDITGPSVNDTLNGWWSYRDIAWQEQIRLPAVAWMPMPEHGQLVAYF